MADRLFADRQYVDELIKNKIDKIDMLKYKSSGERIDIFLFAMALGYNAGYRTKSKSKEGLILESAVKGKDLAMAHIYALAINELQKTGEENKINDTDVVYSIAEEYANTGFSIIEQMIPDISKYNEEEIVFELLAKIEDKIETVNL